MTYVVIVTVVVFGLGYVLNRWVTPWWADRTVNRFMRETAAGKPQKPRDYDYAISHDSEGLVVTSRKRRSEEPLAIRWSEVARAVVFKRDLFAVDCICLFVFRDEESGLELNEEMRGWPELTQALPEYLDGCRPWSEWVTEVASPAFAVNETEIFLRGKAISERGEILKKS